MARHQIIYTSCMRGIDGVNDGQQIFSYDRSFQDSKADDIKGLFTYQIPSLAPGVIMSEEIAETMPAAFCYKRLKNGNAAVTLNTYLGRDYMGSAGRFGNHLSHSIVCDFDDFDVYPCELYGGASLRSRMEYAEVNNPNPPDYLPVPQLERGYTISPDTVIEFLGIGENLDYFKQMVTAMLRFPTEKKRIVICDEAENIVKWIAALHYALPLALAKSVNFTSYEFDPELSPARICGVVSEGTRYNAQSYLSSGRHYVFDFLNQRFSDVDAEEDAFLFFLDTAFSFSYESLTEFHDFVMTKTTYRSADEEYHAAFYLYNLLTEGIGEISFDEFQKITAFAEKYVGDAGKRAIVAKLIEERDPVSGLEQQYALNVLGYMLKQLPLLDGSQQAAVKQTIIGALIGSLSDETVTEEAFTALYDHIDEMARSIQLSIPAELMVPGNRSYLLQVLEHRIELWKVCFIVRILGDYVKDARLPVEELYPDRAIGAIYFQIVRLVFASGRMNGYTIVEKMLENFKTESSYYVNLALNLDGFFKDLALPVQDHQHLWDCVADDVVTTEESYRNAVCTELLVYNRFAEVYGIYVKRLQQAKTLLDARAIFREEFNNYINKSPEYAREYAAPVLKEYVGVFEREAASVPSDDAFQMARELASVAMQMQITDDYIRVVLMAVCEYIPLEQPTPENRKIIRQFYDYYRYDMRQPIEGRLLLLVIGVEFEKVTSLRQIADLAERIREAAGENRAEFKRVSEEEAETYFAWMLGNLPEYGLEASDFTQIYELFAMSTTAHRTFMEYCCKVTYKKSRDEKDYKDFAEFLSFLFEQGTQEDEKMVGKSLCKLSKAKLIDLDEEMQSYFKWDKNQMQAWNRVRRVAAETNPLLSNLSGFFKRK